MGGRVRVRRSSRLARTEGGRNGIGCWKEKQARRSSRPSRTRRGPRTISDSSARRWTAATEPKPFVKAEADLIVGKVQRLMGGSITQDTNSTRAEEKRPGSLFSVPYPPQKQIIVPLGPTSLPSESRVTSVLKISYPLAAET